MWKRGRSIEVLLLAVFAPTMAGGACLQPGISIETTTLDSSGCYKESIFGGLYETMVWTIDGSDVAAGGTKAIVADLENSDGTDPVWVIGTVVSLPKNTWSDGYSAGLQVTDVVCKGTSAFWETEDPTAEVQWACDGNGDGIVSASENGDFSTVACGCPGETFPTPSPTRGVAGGTVAPAADVNQNPTPAPVVRTTAPAPGDPTPASDAPAQTTPTPSDGGALAPTAAACNMTLSSTNMQEVSGCYVGQASSNSRGRWSKQDESAVIEWQTTGSAEQGNWVVVVVGFGVPDELKCVGTADVEDPTEIPTISWSCDLDGEGVFTPAVNFDFEGLECSGSCDLTASSEAIEGSSSSGSSIDRTTAIVIGGAITGVALLAFLVVGAALMRRKRTKAKEVAAANSKASADPNAPPPVFEPWGTRPPPRYYG